MAAEHRLKPAEQNLNGEAWEEERAGRIED
jgi:hypothetical protein